MAYEGEFTRHYMNKVVHGRTHMVLPDTRNEYEVREYASLIPISADLLTDALNYIGPIEPPTRVTRRQRLRWWASRNVTRVRVRVGSWIAGAQLGCEHDD